VLLRPTPAPLAQRLDAAAGGPVISNIVTDPASPTAGVPVDVEATVVDTSGAIEAVTLAWGSSAGSLPNVIGMT
jgi:hypothetical protein